MSEFSFKEIDEEGLETLKAISAAGNFNEWMYKTIAKDCSGEILEIGSGIGNISEYFIKDGYSITLSDLRENYLNFLRSNYTDSAKAIVNLDIVDKDEFDKFNSENAMSFDTVFALNVVEHIEQDDIALKNIYKLLKPGGKVVILVPAFQALYNGFDTALEHYRRYNAKSISTVIKGAGFKIDKTYYFNTAGIAGWWFSGVILRKKTIPQGQMKLYNALVPLFKVIDKLLFNKIGLSVVCVATKQD